MARTNGAVGGSVSCGGVMVMVMVMMMMIMGAAAQAQAPAPAVDCQTVVLTLADCLTFVTGVDKTPAAACCSELSAVISSNPQCLCQLYNTTFTGPIGVNVTLAQQLPPLCKLTTPPTSLCSSFGIPVPGPVSPVAPSPATPASAASPTTASASAPTPSSPSPTTAPAGSMVPSSMPAPTGSVVPAGTPPANTSSMTPAPNSAPSITSQNVAVVATLVFASIFLS